MTPVCNRVFKNLLLNSNIVNERAFLTTQIDDRSLDTMGFNPGVAIRQCQTVYAEGATGITTDVHFTLQHRKDLQYPSFEGKCKFRHRLNF